MEEAEGLLTDCCTSCCCCCCQVIAGNDKGSVAEVERVIPTRGMIVVKGVNVKVCVWGGTDAA